MGVVAARRFDVVLVRLDPTVGSEIRKTRPCLVISPEEMNRHLHTVIVAPMTTSGRAYPSRVAVSFGGRDGLVALDQLRTIDRARIVSVAGSVDATVRNRVLLVLREMFAE